MTFSGRRIDEHTLDRQVREDYRRLCDLMNLEPVELTLIPPGQADDGVLAMFDRERPRIELHLLEEDFEIEASAWPRAAVRDDMPQIGFEPVPRDWPAWRVSLWHECVHQAVHELGEGSPGRQLDALESSCEDAAANLVRQHGQDYVAMVEKLANTVGFDATALAGILLEDVRLFVRLCTP